MTSIEAADDSGVSRTASLNAGEPRGGNATDYNSSVDGPPALRRPRSGMLLGKLEQFLELLGRPADLRAIAMWWLRQRQPALKVAP